MRSIRFFLIAGLLIQLTFVKVCTAQIDCQTNGYILSEECEALLAFYDSTGGDSWTLNRDWTTDSNPCNWYGITCGERLYCTPGSPPVCGYVNRVVGLQLNGNNLRGSIPAQIGDLSALERIEMETNWLEGGLPGEIGNLINIRYIYLSWNSIESIPRQIGNLQNLVTIYLEYNNLQGSIPPEIGNMLYLEELFLHRNNLTGSVPNEITDLQNLKSLGLGSNELSALYHFQLANILLTIVCTVIFGQTAYVYQIPISG